MAPRKKLTSRRPAPPPPAKPRTLTDAQQKALEEAKAAYKRAPKDPSQSLSYPMLGEDEAGSRETEMELDEMLETQPTGPDVAPLGIELLSAHIVDVKSVLERIVEQLEARNALLSSKVETPNVEHSLDTLSARLGDMEQRVIGIQGVTQKIEALEKGLSDVAHNVTAVQDTISRLDKIMAEPIITNGNGDAPKRRGRPPKAAAATVEVAQVEKALENRLAPTEAAAAVGVVRDVAAPAPAPVQPAPTTDLVNEAEVRARVQAGATAPDLMREFHISHARASAFVQQSTYKPPRPCPGCGVNLDNPNPVHSTACSIAHPPAAPATPPALPAEPPTPAPAPAAAPSLDDVRAVAITFAGKHGKDKLAEVLKRFGADKLSSVPEEQRAGLMAALNSGV